MLRLIPLLLLAFLLGAAAVWRPAPPEGRVSADTLESLAKGSDSVVRRVGDLELRASDVYRVLDLSYPALVEETLEQMVMTLGVRLEASREAVDVDAEQLAGEVSRAMTEQRALFASQVATGVTLEEYLGQRHGMTPEAWAAEARRMVLASLMRDRVVRLNAWRQPRDELQIILVEQPELADEIAGKLADQASFSALAKQHSVHPSAAEGGLMPPLTADLDVPLVAGRERLEPGDYLGPAPISVNGQDFLRFVRLVDRLPAEPASWNEVRERVEISLSEQAVGPDELIAFEGALRERYGVQTPAQDDSRP